MDNTKINSDSINIRSGFIKNNLKNIDIGSEKNLPIELTNGDATIALLNENGDTSLNTLYINGLDESVNDVLKKYASLKEKVNNINFYFMSIRAEQQNRKYDTLEMSDSQALYTGKYKLKILNNSQTESITITFCEKVIELKPKADVTEEIELEKGQDLIFRIVDVPENKVSHTTNLYSAYASLSFVG